MATSKSLPKGIVTATWIILAWIGGYLHAQAVSSGTQPPTGPYRSIPSQTGPAAGQPIPSPQPDPAMQQAMPEQAQWQNQQQVPYPQGQGPGWGPPSYPGYSRWTPQQWEERRKAYEEQQRQAQEAMQQRHQEMMQRRQQMQGEQAQGADATAQSQWGPPGYQHDPRWAPQQREERRKAFEEQQRQAQEAMQQRHQEMMQRRQQMYGEQAQSPDATAQPQWGPPAYQNDPRWAPQWQARRQEFEQRRQQGMPPPRQQWRDGPQQENPWTGAPGWGPPASAAPQPSDESQQAAEGMPQTPAYPSAPNYYGPGPGYYPPAWGNRGYGNAPYWR